MQCRLSEAVFEYLLCWASYFEFAANQSLLDREITYLLRDIDRKRDTADMRSEAKQRERREKRQKRKQESKERVFLKPFLKKRNK